MPSEVKNGHSDATSTAGQKTSHHMDATDSDGFLMDIDVQPIWAVPKMSFKDCSHDIDHLFSQTYKTDDKNH